MHAKVYLDSHLHYQILIKIVILHIHGKLDLQNHLEAKLEKNGNMGHVKSWEMVIHIFQELVAIYHVMLIM